MTLTHMKRLLAAALLAAALLGSGYTVSARPAAKQTPAQPYTPLEVIRAAFANHKSNVPVTQEGVVVKVLPDDNQGDRHQRFILRLANGQTLLFAHNIDLAKRIPDLREQGRVIFHGDYMWSNKGGVVHWTHKDPAGKHPGGWLMHKGKRYE